MNNSIGVKQMILTVQQNAEDVILFHIAGIGTMTIDWGDGTPCKTHTLLDYDNNWWGSRYDYEFRHSYQIILHISSQ